MYGEDFSGRTQDLNGMELRARPGHCSAQTHFGEGGRCAVRIRSDSVVDCSEALEKQTRFLSGL